MEKAVLEAKSQVCLDLPDSKSLLNRYLFLSAFGLAPKKIFAKAGPNDCQIFLSLLTTLGARFLVQEDSIICTQVIELDRLSKDSYVLDCQDCGLAFRFFTTLGGFLDKKVTITGTKHLLGRPIDELIEALQDLGVEVQKDAEKLVIKGPIKINRVQIYSTRSSQFLSALLFVGAIWGRSFEIQTSFSSNMPSFSYVNLSLELLKSEGLVWQWNEKSQSFSFQSNKKCSGDSLFIEADYAAASYLVIGAQILQKPIFLDKLSPHSLQADGELLSHIKQLGMTYEVHKRGIVFCPAETFDFFDFDFTLSPDLSIGFAVLALFAKKPCILRGLSTLYHKESNRIEAIMTNCQSLGACVELLTEDTLCIHPGWSQNECEFKDFNDHRAYMAFSLLSLHNPKLKMQSSFSYKKSFPDFMLALQKLRKAC